MKYSKQFQFIDFSVFLFLAASRKKNYYFSLNNKQKKENSEENNELNCIFRTDVF